MINKIKATINKLVQYYNDNGAKKIIRLLLNRLGFVCYDRNLIFLCMDLNTMKNGTSEPYSFCIAKKDDILHGQNYHDFWFTKKEALQRLKKGHRLFVLKDREEMIYFAWIEEKASIIGWFSLRLKLSSDVVYLTGVYTLPQYRRQGIAYKIKKEILHYLSGEGVKKVIEVVDPLNSIALKIDHKLGFKEYQEVNYRRYWLVKYYCVKKHNSNQKKIFVSLLPFSNSLLWKRFL